MMKDCLQFLVEPAKKLKIRIKESRKKVKNEKKEPLLESQLFIMDLARELNRLCQKSDVLAHVWRCEDVWPPHLCREFIMEWSATLENKKRTLLISPRPERRDWKGHLLSMLDGGGETDMAIHRSIIMDWVREHKAKHQLGVWPGEPVLMVLDDLEFQWRRGRLMNLRSAMELVIWAVMSESIAEKETIPRLWLSHKQKNQKTDAIRYIPHALWNWICEASEEVTIDPDTANPDLAISDDNKRMRCGLERRDTGDGGGVRRFNGWWCTLASERFNKGRHYWEVEVGERDWRLGVAQSTAVRRGYHSLNTESGYLTLRLERGQELKALTVPATPLPAAAVPHPRKVGIYLDYDGGQLSFYDVERRAHIYTFSGSFRGQTLVPVFGTVEVVKDLVIRDSTVREPCFCPGPCLWS